MTTKQKKAEKAGFEKELHLRKYVNPSITEDQIKDAIVSFRNLFPENEKLASISDSELTKKVSDFLKSPDVFTPHVKTPSQKGLLLGDQVQSCPMAIAIVVVDCVFMVLGFVGLHATYTAAVKRAAATEATGIIIRDLPGWKKLIEALYKAGTTTEKALAIFNIAKAAYKAGMIRGIIGTIAGTMSALDWAITGVAAVAQIGVLFLTDGAAFIAEVVLNAAAVAMVVSDSVEAVTACNS